MWRIDDGSGAHSPIDQTNGSGVAHRPSWVLHHSPFARIGVGVLYDPCLARAWSWSVGKSMWLLDLDPSWVGAVLVLRAWSQCAGIEQRWYTEVMQVLIPSWWWWPRILCCLCLDAVRLQGSCTAPTCFPYTGIGPLLPCMSNLVCRAIAHGVPMDFWGALWAGCTVLGALSSPQAGGWAPLNYGIKICHYNLYIVYVPFTITVFKSLLLCKISHAQLTLPPWIVIIEKVKKVCMGLQDHALSNVTKTCYAWLFSPQSRIPCNVVSCFGNLFPFIL